jgi:hypothetical protein
MNGDYGESEKERVFWVRFSLRGNKVSSRERASFFFRPNLNSYVNS